MASWTTELAFDERGLIPVVTQEDSTGNVLMVAYMNQEALEQTLRTGEMCYFSRSRQALWIKGESSGHRQRVKELRIDCDRDTLLARVEQVGAACHHGYHSCFYRRADADGLEIVDTQEFNPDEVYKS